MTDLLNNTTFLVIVFAGVLAMLAFVMVIAAAMVLSKGERGVSKRVQDFVIEREVKKVDTSTKTRQILPRDITGTLFSRTLVPFMKGVVDFLGRFTPASSVAKINHQLAIAGNPMNMHAQEFYGVRVLFLLVGIGGAVWINYNHIPLDGTRLLMGVVVIVFSMLIPYAWLNSEVRKAQDEIRRNLPDALDMLSVCASAGLGFDQSLQKITEYWPTALGKEFKRVTQEIEMGVSRSQALRNMSDRLDVDDLTSFIAIIVQAEEMGMSFADVLHSQAAQMRILRQFRAKEIANKMPAKMIIPLAIFIFPALIAVILGPIIPTLFNLF